MPITDKKINDYFAENDRTMRMLKEEIKTLKAKQLTTAPDFKIADGYGSGIGADYQIAIDSDTNELKYRINGTWYVAGGITEIDDNDNSIIIVNPNGPITDIKVNQVSYTAFNLDTIPAISLGTPGALRVDWTLNHFWSGSEPDPFDYTDPQYPTFLSNGNVVIVATVAQDTTDPVMNPGTALTLGVQTPAPTGAGPNTISIGARTLLDVNGNPIIILNNTGTGHVTATAGITMVVTNSDTVPHDVNWRIDILQIVGA